MVLYAADGFSTDLPIEDAIRQDIIVAYELNKQPLQGQPNLPGNRLVVPGQWGYKWISGIVKIEAVDYDFLGSWERRGYPDRALITPDGTAQGDRSPSILSPYAVLAAIAIVATSGFIYLRRRHRFNQRIDPQQ